MREIKFRAWFNNEFYIDSDFMISNTGELLHIVRSIVGNIISINKVEEEYKLMQFTGLKDKNGKEIYEGDVVRYKYKIWNGDIRTKIYVVTYRLGCFSCTEPNGNFTLSVGYYTTLANGNGLEVIGNIYKNPELLEEAK